MKTIRVTADGKISVVDVDFSDIQSVQNMLGGYVEVVHNWRLARLLGEGIVMLVDEEGLLKELPLNPVGSFFYEGLIVGDFLLAQIVGEDWTAPAQVEELKNRLLSIFQLHEEAEHESVSL